MIALILQATIRMSKAARRRCRGRIAVVRSRPSCMYAPTIHDYFLQDDFGVVGLLFAAAASRYFPRWFVTPWTEDIWGYVPDEIRPFPALSYSMASWFGAAAPGAEPHHEHRAPCAQRAARDGDCAEAAAASALRAGGGRRRSCSSLLPIQAESVAWVTGPRRFAAGLLLLRVVPAVCAVDPAEGGCQRHRRSRSRLPVVGRVLLRGALQQAEHDHDGAGARAVRLASSGRRRVEVSWRGCGPYVPYIAADGGVPALRYVLFHEVARESMLTAQRVQRISVGQLAASRAARVRRPRRPRSGRRATRHRRGRLAHRG